MSNDDSKMFAKDNVRPCPFCSSPMPAVYGPGVALSRQDNTTQICSACGTKEALEDWAVGMNHAALKESPRQGLIYRFHVGQVCKFNEDWKRVQIGQGHPRIAVATATILSVQGDNGRGVPLYSVRLSTGRTIKQLAESHLE